MPLVIPPAVNYQSPLVAVPTRWQNENPPEGPKMIPVEIDWNTMGGANNCVFINLQNNATLNFSQIVALAVDNSSCGGDIQFVFPDTTETVTIPAYSPKVIVPVFTNQTQFYVLGIGVASEDVTRFSIQNVVPPPIAVPTSQEQNAVSVSGVSVLATGLTQLVPATVNGTLETLQVAVYMDGGTLVFDIEDGTGKVIAGGSVTESVGGFLNFVPVDLQDIRVRFQTGLKLNIVSNAGITAGTISVNLYYRTP